MASIYIRKIESALARPLSSSERTKASEFLVAGYTVSYAIEYFR